jgi:uncharacterized protein (TIGR02145 family)
MEKKIYILIALSIINLGVILGQNAVDNLPKFMDPRDGKSYKLVVIGGQTWMAENLNYVIPDNSWCYSNSDSNCTRYGRLYNWDAAKNSCPTGWHLPSDSDWKKLEGKLGLSDTVLDIVGYRGTNQGMRLKEGGNSGFNALMAGYRLWWDGSYLYLGSYTDFWTSTEADKEEAWLRDFSINDATIYRNRINKKYGNSVRCVKD